ncbi:MAG TPA: DUF6498-containing protein [Alphaproteobacteria bacterium]|nr:DUF6498-containing protein [Alphaproteobacteria bacterium]
MVDTTATANLPGWTPALVVRNLLAFAGNMLQVYGVLYWGWDMFQILMLYWMETAVIAFWGLLRLAVLPEGLLGEMTVNGRVVAATNKLLLLMFVPFVVISMAAHLLILWAVFAGTSAAGVHSAVSFVDKFIVASGAWKPLLFTWLAGAVGFYQSPKRAFLARRQIPDVANQHGDGVGPAIGGTLGRIVMLQVATIIGAMLARSYGTIAPWLILIGLKTLTDYQRPDRKVIAP